MGKLRGPYHLKQVMLIAGSLSHIVSGGDIYNEEIVRASQASGYPIEIVHCTPESFAQLVERIPAIGETQTVVIDSLFWPEVAHFRGRLGKYWILVHYVPSENPTLTAEELGLWQDRENIAVLQAQGVICVGPRSADRLRQRFPGVKVRICEPALSIPETRSSLAKASNDPVWKILTVANLVKSKGYSELVAALASARPSSWQWTIVGSDRVDFAYAARLRGEIAFAGLDDRVNFVGVRRGGDLLDTYLVHDLFLFGSWFESFGMALREAWTLGLKIVSTDVGEIQATCDHDSQVLLSRPGDVAGLAQSLEILQTDVRRFRETNQGPKFPLRRSWRTVADEFFSQF